MIRNKKGENLEEYLKNRTIIENSCWLWKGASPGKYGIAEFCKISKPAHRYSYECFIGEIPVDKIVRHKCDNPRCINPLHLEIGTKKDNRKDFMDRNPKAMELCLKAQKTATEGVKKFWDSMTTEERRDFCKRRHNKQKEKYPEWAFRKGKKDSEETKLKKSIHMLGNQYAKGKVSHNKGKTFKDSEETKNKKSESAKRAWKKRRSI